MFVIVTLAPKPTLTLIITQQEMTRRNCLQNNFVWNFWGAKENASNWLTKRWLISWKMWNFEDPKRSTKMCQIGWQTDGFTKKMWIFEEPKRSTKMANRWIYEKKYGFLRSPKEWRGRKCVKLAGKQIVSRKKMWIGKSWSCLPFMYLNFPKDGRIWVELHWHQDDFTKKMWILRNPRE